MSSEPSHRGWTTGPRLEVVVMAKALIASEILCTFASRAGSMIMISIWVSVLSFSHEAVKSMFHTQMRWVSSFKLPCSSDPPPSLAWFPRCPFPDSVAAVCLSVLLYLRVSSFLNAIFFVL